MFKNSNLRNQFECEALPHMDSLYRTALRMTKNEDDANDLVQDTYSKAYIYWDSYTKGSNCRAWLFKILTNIFINNYRSRSRTPSQVNIEDIEDNALSHLMLNYDQYNGNPEEQLFSKIFDDDIKKALEDVPDDYRLIVILSFLEEFSYEEISRITNLKLGTVKSRLFRGRKYLQKALLSYAIKNGFVVNRPETALSY